MIYEDGNVIYGVSNSELLCKNCKYVLDDSKVRGNVSKCKRFNLKPVHVFFGGNCLEYERRKE